MTIPLEAQLYGICDLGYLSREQAEPVSRQLLEGGASVLQLRAKGHDPEALLDLAISLRALCEEFKVPFVVNDHPELAQKSNAHGLHLGQDDGSLAEVRSKLDSYGQNIIFGRSTHSPEQAQAALEEGFDYIGFGPLFPTPTKQGRPGIGLENIQGVQASVGSKIPVFCIGGIKPDNLQQVTQAGAKNVVIVSQLLTAADPRLETQGIINSLR